MNPMSTKEILDTIKLANEDASGITNLKKRKKKIKEINDARMKLQTIDPEDLEIMAENFEARPFFTEKGIKNLYMAICTQAVHDYKQTSKYIAKSNGTQKDLEEARQIKEDATRFFNNDFFKNVTGMKDAKKTEKLIIERMKREAQEKLSMIKA